MEQNELLQTILVEIGKLKLFFQTPTQNSYVSDKWLSRSQVMTFLNYGPTQMATLEGSGELIVSKVGKRKFILRSSLEKYLERNIQDLNVSQNSNESNG